MTMYTYKCRKCKGILETDERVDMRKRKCGFCGKKMLSLVESWGEDGMIEVM